MHSFFVEDGLVDTKAFHAASIMQSCHSTYCKSKAIVVSDSYTKWQIIIKKAIFAKKQVRLTESKAMGKSR